MKTNFKKLIALTSLIASLVTIYVYVSGNQSLFLPKPEVKVVNMDILQNYQIIGENTLKIDSLSTEISVNYILVTSPQYVRVVINSLSSDPIVYAMQVGYKRKFQANKTTYTIKVSNIDFNKKIFSFIIDTDGD